MQDRKAKTKELKPKLGCRNWECGVVVPVRDGVGGGEGEGKGEGKREGKRKEGEGMGLGVFEGRVPVPMVVPGREYDGRRPWFCYER